MLNTETCTPLEFAVFPKHLLAFLFLKACRDFLSLAQNHSKHWQKALQVERNQRIRLEDTLEQLAKQHNHLERAFRGATVLPSHNNPAIGSKGKSYHQDKYQSFSAQSEVSFPSP